MFLTAPSEAHPEGWETIVHDGLFEVQRDDGKFRIKTTAQASMEICAAGTFEEISKDAEMIRLFIAGMVPQNDPSIPAGVKAVLQDTAANMAKEAQDTVAGESGAEHVLVAGAEWTAPEVLKHVEPWAKTLIENADKLRYVCYAAKIATSIAADASTSGFGGEQVVQMCFAAIDAAVTSSWMAWFAASLADDSVESNVIKKTLQLDFASGPRGVTAAADAICAVMRPDDAAKVERLAMSLKRRLAVLVGDICAVFIPKDYSVGGAMISETLIQASPPAAMEVLGRMVDWYEKITLEHREVLEDNARLSDLVQSGNARLKDAVLEEYEQPLSKKLSNTAKREALSIFVPGGAWVNLLGSAAIGLNVGKDSCEAVFATLDNKLPIIAYTLQKVLAIQFGTMVVLAHCHDRSVGQGTPFTAMKALDLAIHVAASKKPDGKKGGLASGALDMLKSVTKMGKK